MCVRACVRAFWRADVCVSDPRFIQFAWEQATTERGARWPSGLERWTGDRTVRGSNPTAENFSLRNFGNSVYPALPVSFGGDTKSRRSLLSGVYARGSKRPHQSALECVTVVDSTAHSNSPRSASMRRKTLPCTEKGRRRTAAMCRPCAIASRAVESASPHITTTRYHPLLSSIQMVNCQYRMSVC